MSSEKSRVFFEVLARHSPPGDFWRQVGRTVDGMPVDETQIAMTVAAIRRGLDLQPGDVVLDLGCGNGALSRRVFDGCAGGVGVDFAEGMVATARANFEDPPRVEFVCADVERYIWAASEPERFTKGLCFFAFQYLAPSSARALLRALRARFTSLEAFFVGDVPDRSRMPASFYRGAYRPEPSDFESPFGVWRAPCEFVELAQRSGWNAEIQVMDAAYHAAHIRYNAVLRPAER
jgi:SAM-dependent methyltransferase